MMLNDALAYAGNGYPVLPLHSPENGGCSCHKKDCSDIGKHPRTMNGLKDATIDAKKITQWWTMWPQANIGLATGAVSDSAWVDIDPRHGGTESIKSLQARHGKVVERFVQKTGGDGWHLGFKHPGFRVRNIQSTVDRPGALGPGVDVRGDGGYIVAAPSLHSSGKRYQFPKPLNGNLPEMPGWLKTILQSPPKQAAGAIDGDIREGQRNNTLASLAGSMRRRNMSAEAILSALRTENETRCSPPLPDDEVVRIAGSVSRYEPGPEPSADRGANDREQEANGGERGRTGANKQPRPVCCQTNERLARGCISASARPAARRGTVARG